MLHRNFMRRGVSLEVILEEDDNAEVSFDPITFEDETDSNSSSSPTSSSGRESGALREGKEKRGPLNNFERLREEKERRKRKKEEEDELWRGLEKQRSLSCETLTILDVGDDEFSREQWEEEARNWGVAEGTNGGHQIEHSISRKKILLQAASRSGEVAAYDDQYDSEPENRETLSEDDLEAARSSETINSERGETRIMDPDITLNPDEAESVRPALDSDCENRQDLTDLNEKSEDNADPVNLLRAVDQKQNEMSECEVRGKITSDPFVEEELSVDDNLACNRFQEKATFDPFHPDPIPNDEDSWITVGELETGSSEGDNVTERVSKLDTADEVIEIGKVEGEERKGKEEVGNENVGEEEETEKKEEEENEEPSRQKSKEVRFREEPEYVNERAELVFIDDSNTDDDDDVSGTSSSKRAPHRRTSPVPEELSNLFDVKAGREIFEASSAAEGKKDLPPPIYDRLSTALENTRVLIVEKPPSSSLGNTDVSSSPPPSGTLKMSQTDIKVPSPPSSSSTSPACFNAHNVELHPEELPPPHTVASVRQLFEQIPAAVTLQNDNVFDFQSRFDHVRSNPSSKILRFDRDRRLHSTPPDTRTTSTISSSSSLPKNFKGEEAQGRSHNKKDVSVSRPTQGYCSTGVHLRKPRVARGFDVRKALRENPRYFHIRLGEKSKEDKDKTTTSSKTPSVKQGTITYSYVEAKHQSQRGSTTTLRWTKETIDRSDAESMSSESSEDSGVSKDFSSSIITSFSKSSSGNKKTTRWSSPRIVDKQFASDPSFKWIDPTVLAKIRSRGTTVIYFGPRRRPPGASRDKTAPWWNPTLKGNAPEGNKCPASTLTQIIERDDENELERGRGGVHTPSPSIEKDVSPITSEVTFAQKASYASGESPKIVGVKHKKATVSSSGIRKARSPDRERPPRFKPFPHRDSIYLPKRDAKNKSTGNNSIIYDFTQKQSMDEEDFG